MGKAHMRNNFSGKFLKRTGIAAAALAMVSAAFFFRGNAAGTAEEYSEPEYAKRLFDNSRVHTIDIQTENWNDFVDEASEEKYLSCTLVVDGETYQRTGVRVKGNNSKKLIEKYGWKRYSLKIKFDCFTEGQNYHGLDKLSLDTSFQDNSYMKNYLTYKMMDHMGVPSPLCSYVWVTVNGEDRGLFLAVEEPGKAFARRNYGEDYGQLYKPDYKRLEDENADIALGL